MFTNLFRLFSAFLLLVSIYATPTFDTTSDPINEVETSTAFKQISEHTTADELVQNQTALIINATSVPIVTTSITDIPNSTSRVVTVAGKIVNGKLVTYNTTYNYYTATSSPSPGLSGGAIAGIIIGIIILVCCCGVLGCCKKSGHWENARVWVND